MTETEELHRMLDERGVEWAEYGGGYTEFWVRTAVDGERYYIDVKHYTVQPNVMCSLIVAGLTPAQVIAATLGAETCKLSETCIDHGHIEYNGITEWRKCSACGNEVLTYPANFCPNCGARVVDE